MQDSSRASRAAKLSLFCVVIKDLMCLLELVSDLSIEKGFFYVNKISTTWHYRRKIINAALRNALEPSCRQVYDEIYVRH